MAGSRKEYEMLFQLNAQLGSSYNSSFSKAQAEITAMQNQIQSLSKTQGDISAYEKQQAALEATRQKMVTLQQQYDNIQKEIAQTEGFSSALENRLLAKQQQIDKTSASMDRQTQNLQELGEALRKAGVDTSNFTGESARLETEIAGLRNKQEAVADGAKKMGSYGAQAILEYQQALVASGIQDALRAIYNEISACADASVGFESAITGVYKTVDGTDQQLVAIKGDIKDMATDIPATTDEIAAVAEAAGQLGIATDYVMEFSRVMIDLGESTNLASEEAAPALAKFSNITGTLPKDYSRLGSVIVDLGNNYATTEADILAMATRLASSGKLAGLTEPQIMALATAMSSVGIEAEAGGTAMTQTLSEIEKAVAKGNEDLTGYARIAGMSAEEFAAAWKSSPIEAVQSFIAGVGALDQKGESAVLVLEELGLTGIRQSDMLKRLGLAADTLTGAVNTANTAWDENIALSQEAGKRYATTASQQAMMENSFNNLRVAIGDTYTPALRELYGVGNDTFAMMTRFVEANPGLVKGMTATVGVIALVTGGLAAYAVGAKVAAAATALLTSTIPGVNIIMGVTAGVAALTGVMVGLSEATDGEADAIRSMTESSREEYARLQALKGEYESACQTYGETSDQARYLSWQVDELSSSFDANRQSLEEYIAECDAANESMTKMLDGNRSSYEEIGENEGITLALVSRLKELAAQTDQTAESQEEMKAIIAELNGIVPELAFNYDDAVAGVTDYAAAIEGAVKAKADAERYEAAQSNTVDAYNAQVDAQMRLKDLTNQHTAAKERFNVAEQKYFEYLKEVSKYDTTGNSAISAMFSNEYKEYEAAREAFDSYTAKIQETQDTLNQATSDYEYYKDALVGCVEETENAKGASDGLTGAISGVTSQAELLAEAYQSAYTAAYESVSGQYELWEKAADVSAISAETISGAMQSQTTYWQEYNSNLQALAERGKDIEGLGEYLASFADGSAQSVNAVAGLATATDADLAAMVEDWKTLQTEHKNVSDSIAELQVGLTTKTDEMVRDLEATIKEMNLSEDAAASGRNTIQGFINGANDMLPQVEAVYTNIANRAKKAIDTAMDIHSPSREMAWRAEMTWAGYINQTRAMEPEVEKAMAEAANMGVDAADIQLMAFAPQLLSAISSAQGANEVEKAMAEAANMGVDAADVQLMAFAPQLLSAIYSAQGANVVEAQAQSVRSEVYNPIQVTIRVDGDATPETVDRLNMYGEEFAERVRAVIEDDGIDAERRAY